MTALLSPLREGRITGSRVAAVLGIRDYVSRKGTLREMVRQAWGDPAERVENEWMAYGHEHEADAITAYETTRGVMVHGCQQFFIHPDHDYLAVTVDGLVGDDGMVEVKCPPPIAKYNDIADKPNYDAQIRLQLACTGREWCDFVVWREGEPLAVSRVEHDALWLPAVLPKLERFIGEYRRVVADRDAAMLVRWEPGDVIRELFTQRDLARTVAAKLEDENASLLDTLASRELAS